MEKWDKVISQKLLHVKWSKQWCLWYKDHRKYLFYKMKSFHFPDADNFETAFSVSD